jgi:hypothetical protein
MNKLLYGFLVISIIISACNTGVDTINPYDPDTPQDKQAQAALSGSVSLEGYAEVSQTEIYLVPSGKSTHPDSQGNYLIEGIEPTVQEIHFVLEGYQERVEVRNMGIGETVELDVRLSVLRGGVIGEVELEGQNDHSGAIVVLSPQPSITMNIGSQDFQLAATTAPSGNYVFDNVPVGTYMLSASKPHYQGKVVNSVIVMANSTVEIDPLVLPPVTGAVTIFGGDQDRQSPDDNPPNFDNPDYPSCCPNTRFTRTQEVRLRTHGFNALLMKASEDIFDLEDNQGWNTYQTDQEYILSDGDGAKTVYVLLEGENQIRSDVLEGHIVLDTQAPELADLGVGNGTGYTNDTGVSVEALGFDQPSESGIAEMRINIGAAPGQSDPWQAYNMSAPLILPDLDGQHEVYVQVRDRAGNQSSVISSVISLDRNPPQPGPIENGPPVQAGNGSGFVLSTDVPLSFNIVDQITPSQDLQMVICESEGCPGVAFSPYVSRTVVSFNTAGEHTLYAIFKDGANNIYQAEPVVFTIDTDAPTTPIVAVEEGSAVQDIGIHLLIDSIGADLVKISEDPTFSGADWIDYQNRIAFSLDSVQGAHNVFVMVSDYAGHISGPAVVAVTLDNIPPQGTLHILMTDPTNQCVANLCYSNSESALVEVTVTSNDDTSKLSMVLSLDDLFDEPIQLYSPMALVQLQNTTLPQTIHLRLIDQAGNFSDIQSDNQARLDLSAPTLPIISTLPSEHTNQTNIVLERTSDSDDDSGEILRYEYQIEPPPSYWGTQSWQEAVFDGNNQIAITLDDCAANEEQRIHLFKVRAIDRAGNMGDPASTQLILDQTAPDTPEVSVNAGQVDPGPKVVNAEAVTIWVSLDSSSDPNFDQFQTRARTSADNGLTWGAWSSYNDTGVGSGNIQIPFILDQENMAHQVEVRGTDLAGNLSVAASVYFSEDSSPPSPPIVFPTEAEINADQVTMLIEVASQDDHEIVGYECSVNGSYVCQIKDEFHVWQTVSELPQGTERFRIGLEQNKDNVIHLRGIDQAGNRSGTSFATITENSTVVNLETISSSGSVAEVMLDQIDSTDMEGSLLVASARGKEVDTQLRVEGLLAVDLSTNTVGWLTSNRNVSHLTIKNKRVVFQSSLNDICSGTTWGDILDEVGDTSGNDLCQCNAGNMTNCNNLHPYIQNALSSGSLSSLILADLSTGLPVYRWIRTSASQLGVEHPIFREDYSWDRYNLFSYDGKSITWAEGPDIHEGTNLSRVYSARITDGCDPVANDCLWISDIGGVGYFESNNTSQVGNVSAGGDYLAWMEVDTNQISSVKLAQKDTQTIWTLPDTGVDYDLGAQQHAEMTFDCFIDGTSNEPICNYLFWVDFNDSPVPTLMAIDLAEVPTPTQYRLRIGMIELRRLRAEAGRIVWVDFGSSSDDVFYLDMNDPEQCPGTGADKCLDSEKILIGGAPRDERPCIWGDYVGYWRNMGTQGYKLQVHDVGSQPWLFTRPGLQGFLMGDEDKYLVGWINPEPETGDLPNQMDIYDPLQDTFTKLGTVSSLSIPISFLVRGSDYYLAYYSIIDGGYGLFYCDSQNVSCESPARIDQTEILDLYPGQTFMFFGAHGRSSQQRIVWSQISNTGLVVVLDCDIDPSGSKPCYLVTEADDSSYRKLLEVDPSAPELCGLAVGGDHGMLVLRSGDDIGDLSTGYRLDYVELDSLATPTVITDLEFDPATKPGIVERLDDGSWEALRRCGDGFMNYVHADPLSGRLVFGMPTRKCESCVGDDPATDYEENCSNPPCCGNLECDCTNAAGCNYYGSYNQVMTFPPPSGNNPTIANWFSQERLEDIAIYGNWIAWIEKIGGQNDIFVFDINRNLAHRLIFDTKDQNLLDFSMMNDGLHLHWMDSRLGAAQLFHMLMP